MFHKIRSAYAVPELKVLIHFCEGESRIYNLEAILGDFPQFGVLKTDRSLFQAVRVDKGGFGISWNDELDLGCNELWSYGEKIATPFDGIMAFCDATNIWGLSESTLRKALEYGRLCQGVDVCRYGNQWVITMEAMTRVYGKPPEDPCKRKKWSRKN